MPTSTQQRGHELTTDDRKAWLERNTFRCPVYGANISPQTCAANRKRPLLTEGAGMTSSTNVTLCRHPLCGEDCTTWAEQRDKNAAAKSTSPTTRRGTCENCGRVNMALIKGMCGPCDKLRTAGEIVPTRGGQWLPKDIATAAPTLMGTDPEEALCTESELADLATAHVQDEWEPYNRILGHMHTAKPACTLNKARELVINTAAVSMYELGKVEHVRLLYNRTHNMLALEPMAESKHPQALKLTRPTGTRDFRAVAFKGFLQVFGLSVRQGVAFELTKTESGRLVATLELQPEQSVEA